MRISGEAMSYAELQAWRLIDMKTQEQICGVVWADDETDTYAQITEPVEVHNHRYNTTIIKAPKIIISTGLKMIWVNCKPPEEEEQQDEAILRLVTEST